MAVMVTSFQRTYASILCLPGLLYSVPLTPQQATVNPRLHQRLLDTQRQVWLSLLWDHCSFLLGPGTHKILLVPSESVSPVLWKFCNQIPPAFKVKFPDGSQYFCQIPGWEIVVDHRTFATVEELLWCNCSPVCQSPA